MSRSPEYPSWEEMAQSQDPIDFAKIMQSTLLTRRDFLGAGFLAGLLLGGGGLFLFREKNPSIKDLSDLMLNNLPFMHPERRMSFHMLTLSQQEAEDMWFIGVGDSLVRGQADNQMQYYTDTRGLPDLLSGELERVYGVADIGHIKLYTKDPSDPKQPNQEQLINFLRNEYVKYKGGSINAAQNSVFIQAIPEQLNIIEKSGFFEHAQQTKRHIIICQSGGGNNADQDFRSSEFSNHIATIAQKPFTLERFPEFLDFFNKISTALAPVASATYDNLVCSNTLSDSYKNIRGVKVLGNVNLGYSEGLIAPFISGGGKLSSVLIKKQQIPAFVLGGSIYSLILQEKKLEGIAQFRQDYPNSKLNVQFEDIYSTLGTGIYNGERTFLYEHPTFLGYTLMLFAAENKVSIDGKTMYDIVTLK